MSILHSPSFIFNSTSPMTTVKISSFTSFFPPPSITKSKFRNFSTFPVNSSFNDYQDFLIAVNKLAQNDSVSEDEQIFYVDEWGEKSKPDLQPSTKLSGSDPPIDVDEWGAEVVNSSGIQDEWGEKSFPELQPTTTLSDSDPPIDEDEWMGAKLVRDNTNQVQNGWVEKSETQPVPYSDPLRGKPEWGGAKLVAETTVDVRVAELKKRLMDTVYDTDFGLKASSEVRAEALELVSQLEAANPTSSPIESPELFDGNWILVFTAFSELLPLLAVGTIPFLKVEKISQEISTSSLTIKNSTTLSSPVVTSSFSATAAFEVQSPSRIQVEFKEGTFNPPDIKTKIDLPESMEIFGQKITLSPVHQSLSPLENAVAVIAQTISGLPPLKIPIPGERTKSWLITTYLDKDLRISRGDGGLFVLVKEESSLLDL